MGLPKKPDGKKVYEEKTDTGRVFDPVNRCLTGEPSVIEVRIQDDLSFIGSCPQFAAVSAAGPVLRDVVFACRDQIQAIADALASNVEEIHYVTFTPTHLFHEDGKAGFGIRKARTADVRGIGPCHQLPSGKGGWTHWIRGALPVGERMIGYKKDVKEFNIVCRGDVTAAVAVAQTAVMQLVGKVTDLIAGFAGAGETGLNKMSTMAALPAPKGE